MNFKISKRIFYNALQTVSRAISPNSPLPALSGIKIEVEQESITLTGSDADTSICKTLNGQDEDLHLLVKETGSIILESRYILEIVRKIDAEDIEIEIIDGSLTRISGYQAEFKINGMRGNDYPAIDFSKPNVQFSMDPALLSKIITQTIFATSDKEIRPVLTGVNFKANGSHLECVATDSYRLAKKVVTIENEQNFNITIPSKSLSEVAKILDEKEEVLIALNDKKIQFYVGDTIIQNRLIDGAYPETGRLIPTNFDYILNIESSSLLNAIDRASFIKNEGISIIKLSMDENEVIISSKSQEVGSCTETLYPHSYQGPHLDISFSGKYVYDAIRALGEDNVVISFSGEMKPFVIKSEKDDSILQLILPVRTYN